jgi:hypothetical protein
VIENLQPDTPAPEALRHPRSGSLRRLKARPDTNLLFSNLKRHPAGPDGVLLL